VSFVLHIKGNMNKILLSVFLLLSIFVEPSGASEMKEIKSSDELARFIFHMAKEEVSANKLLNGIESSETLKIPGHEAEIPVREVFGTIVVERFGDKLTLGLFENDKKYGVREICAFRDSKGQVWRFSITILEERQYIPMKQYLEKLVNKQR
jgi:hypothetical protein